MATFPNLVARVWPLWLEGLCQASNVKVVVGDLFATPNLLKSHTQRNLLSPYSNIRAVTSKLCDAAGYNFSLLLRWLEELLRVLSLILRHALLAAPLHLTQCRKTFFTADYSY